MRASSTSLEIRVYPCSSCGDAISSSARAFTLGQDGFQLSLDLDQLTLEIAVASLDQAIGDLIKGFNVKAVFNHFEAEKFKDCPNRLFGKIASLEFR